MENGRHVRLGMFIVVGRGGYASVPGPRGAAVGTYAPVGDGDVPVRACGVGLLGEGVGPGTGAYHGMCHHRKVSPLALYVGDDGHAACRRVAGGEGVLGGTGCREKGEARQAGELFFHSFCLFKLFRLFRCSVAQGDGLAAGVGVGEAYLGLPAFGRAQEEGTVGHVACLVGVTKGRGGDGIVFCGPDAERVAAVAQLHW